jgi:hypothetical protein
MRHANFIITVFLLKKYYSLGLRLCTQPKTTEMFITQADMEKYMSNETQDLLALNRRQAQHKGFTEEKTMHIDG